MWHRKKFLTRCFICDTPILLHQIYATSHLQHEPVICTTRKCRSRCLKLPMVYTTYGVADTNYTLLEATWTLESSSSANELSTVGTNYQHMLSKPKLSTVSNIDWTIIVRVAAVKATASAARHHQSQSQRQLLHGASA